MNAAHTCSTQTKEFARLKQLPLFDPFIFFSVVHSLCVQHNILAYFSLTRKLMQLARRRIVHHTAYFGEELFACGQV